MAKESNGIIGDFEKLLAHESAITEKMAALESELETLRIQRNQAVGAWLEKYGTPGKDRLGRRTVTRKPFSHKGVTYQVLMAYQGKDANAKSNAYIRRVSTGDLA